MTSTEVDSPRTLFFCVSRNRVVAHGLRKVLSGASPGIMPSVLWNFILWQRKFRGEAVGTHLGIFAQLEAEEEPNLNEVCGSFGLF